MNSTQIRCFLAAAEASSFTEAAERLYLSQPTFGRHISALEQELGFPLFVRSRNPYRLTPAGEIMLESLHALSGAFERDVARARAVASGQVGRLRIGLLEGQLMEEPLRRAVQELRAQCPGLAVDVEHHSFRSMFDALTCGELDLGITLTEDILGRSGLAHLPLFSLENAVVLPAGHPLAGRSELTLRDLQHETFIEFSADESPAMSGRLLASCREAGFRPETLVTADLRSQILALESGRGIAAFNVHHVLCNHPGLAHVPLKAIPPSEFSAAWPETSENPALPPMLALLRRYYPDP